MPAKNPKSFVTPYNFLGGTIQVACVFIDNMVVHAYRLHRAHGSDQWFAPVKTDMAGAATRLAYGRDTFRGKQKTAAEVWEEMLPYLEPIPQSE